MTSGWDVDVVRRAHRDLRNLDPSVRQRIRAALQSLVAEEASGDLIKLTGKDEWRLRVGDWRVLVELRSAERVVRVLRVLPRGRAYR